MLTSSHSGFSTKDKLYSNAESPVFSINNSTKQESPGIVSKLQLIFVSPKSPPERGTIFTVCVTVITSPKPFAVT